MEASGGRQPQYMDAFQLDAGGVMNEEERLGSKPTTTIENHHIVENNNNNNNNNHNRGISIAERRAAKCGFNASNINEARFRTTDLAPPVLPPYFTIPPGISPSALLDSPIMLPNAQAQLSPTTGITFQFPSPNQESLSKPKLELANDIKVLDQSSSNARAANKPALEEYEYQNFQEMAKEVCFIDALDNKIDTECSSSRQSNTSNIACKNQMLSHNDCISKEKRPPEKHPKATAAPQHIPKETAKYAEDGYCWRKYGQKQVKGSEFPRSYYKCTNTNCLVKKKVERSHDGQVTEIVYKGTHSHPQPQPPKIFGEVSDIGCEGAPDSYDKVEGNLAVGKDVAFSPGHWRPDGLDVASFTPLLNDLPDPLSRTFNNNTLEFVESQEFSLTFCSSQDGADQDQASPDSISINDEGEENGECETRKRKQDSMPNETTTATQRSTREPKVVVQIESDIDILDDGYRWRKYGQKVVKGNPNPRSYYKCTTPGCPVRKHVERAADDIKSVVTTYEGKHNHEVPSSKTGNLVISDVANLPPNVTNSMVNPSPTPTTQDMPKPSKQVQDHLPLYMDRKPPILSYSELIRSTSILPGSTTFSSDTFNFGASSMYPLSFPPFQSLPYGSLMVNNNHMKAYNPSNLYPMLPDYMSSSLPPSINHHIPAAGTTNVPAVVGGNFHFNNYASLETSTRGQEYIRGHHSRIMKPKKEEKDEGDLSDACLSTTNH